MPNYAVIDLGSNTIRLVIYEVKDDTLNSYSNKDFKSLLNDKVVAGLSAFVSQGAFSQKGVDRAVRVLKGHLKRAGYFNCKNIQVFSTAVLRNASNGAEAVKAIEQASNLHLSLLSARDEAHLGFVGATCDREIQEGTLVDIGGGSTELTSIKNNKDSHKVSISQGSLSSYAAFVSDILPTVEEMKAIANSLDKHLVELPNFQVYKSPLLYGIGGSVRAAAKMLAQMSGESSRPKTMTPRQIHEILSLCRNQPSQFAHWALKASAERINTLVPGCLILDTLMANFQTKTLEVCKYGVREGYLIERMLKA